MTRRKTNTKPEQPAQPQMVQPIIYVIDELHRLPPQVLQALQQDRDQVVRQEGTPKASTLGMPNGNFVDGAVTAIELEIGNLLRMASAVHDIADSIHGPSPSSSNSGAEAPMMGLTATINHLHDATQAVAAAIGRLNPNFSY
jgi:hypothetical protein